ncbi:MAG: CHRD domain-containing protein [Caulobacteraceae bacterium]
MSLKMFAAAAMACCLAAGAAHAEVVHFSAVLKGADEVPANDTTGQGHLVADLDTATKTLTYQATYSGLTGPATAAHFHGPAAPGVNAGVMVPVQNPESPISGQATLTDTQITDLTAGKWYFNVHTKAHPGGEIRGQVGAGQ